MRSPAAHDCLSAVPSLTRTEWPVLVDGSLRLVPVRARVRANGLEMVRRAALAGAGVAHIPEFAVADDVRAGRLERVLEAHSPEVGGIHVVYPHGKLRAPTVSVLVALAVERYPAGPPQDVR